jgi:hypothetical protein
VTAFANLRGNASSEHEFDARATTDRRIKTGLMIPRQEPSGPLVVTGPQGEATQYLSGVSRFALPLSRIAARGGLLLFLFGFGMLGIKVDPFG